MSACRTALALLGACAPGVADERPVPRVFAHYYTWWAGDRPEYPLMPQIGWYAHRLDASGRPRPANLFPRHFAQARGAGLAGFSFEWPGKDSPETRLILDGPVAVNARLPASRRMRYLMCFDSTIWAMEYRKLIGAWHEPIVFDEATAADFAAQMRFVCEEIPKRDPAFDDSYLHIDGRPAVFVYNAHGFAGQWAEALRRAREACEPAGGIFLIGDFEVSPHPMFDQRRKDEYPAKARHFDAVSDYTLFSGHTFVSLWEYIETGQLDAALANGRHLAESTASGQYYPGIIPQYFRSRAAGADDAAVDRRLRPLRDRVFVTDGSMGFAPVFKAEAAADSASVTRESRCTLQLLVRTVLASDPRIVFVTSWNEPYEGTMIEPTRSPNPAGYTMGDDFLDILGMYLGRDADENRESAVDFDMNGRVDDRDEAIWKACLQDGSPVHASPCCRLAETIRKKAPRGQSDD